MAGVEQVATMLLTTGLRVVHLTTHRPLRLACDAVTRDNVLAKLRLTHEYFSAHGFAVPRIAAAALNPHAGEAGIIGSEEIDAIAPAVADACAQGMDVTGPIPADSVFNRAIDGEFDVVLAMYHDQGHIAVKVQDWAASATTNLGLPLHPHVRRPRDRLRHRRPRRRRRLGHGAGPSTSQPRSPAPAASRPSSPNRSPDASMLY